MDLSNRLSALLPLELAFINIWFEWYLQTGMTLTNQIIAIGSTAFYGYTARRWLLQVFYMPWPYLTVVSAYTILNEKWCDVISLGIQNAITSTLPSKRSDET